VNRPAGEPVDPGASLEPDLECPECRAREPLLPPRGPLRARCCGGCGGALLGPADADVLLARAGGRVTPALRSRGAIRCPSCAGPLARGVVAGTPYSPCSRCGAAWIGAGPALGAVEAALGGPRSRSGARAPRRRRAAMAAGLAALAALAASAGAAAFLSVKARPAPPPPPAAPPPELAAAPPAAPAPAAEPAAAAAAPEAAATAAAPATASPSVPTFAPAAAEVEELRLGPDQPRLLLARRAGARAALVVSFAAGSVDDGSVVGLTRVAQHALLAANARLDLERLALDVHATGAALQLLTGPRDASFLLAADRRDFGPLAARLLEGLLEPRFVPARLGRATARALLDAPGEPDLLQVVTMLAAEDTRYGNPAVGQRNEIEAIDADQVARHLAGPLSPAAATIVVAGSFDRDELIRQVRRFRGGRSAAPATPRLAVPFSARRPAARELNLLAYPLSIQGARQAAAARIAARLLDGVLWRRFRGAGVGYSFAAQAYRTRWLDLLAIALPAHDSSSDLGAALREVVREVRRGEFGDADLERARAAVRGELRRVDADPVALARELGASGALWHSAAVAREVEALRREDVVNAVAPWLDDVRSVSLYLGPRP
jgi:predicted Zn-dependent peptidase